MRHYQRAKKDENHAEIVKFLRAIGATVIELHAVGGGVPDLLVGYKRRTFLLEVKRPGVAGKKRGRRQAMTNKAQADFYDSWRGGAVHVVEDWRVAISIVSAAA